MTTSNPPLLPTSKEALRVESPLSKIATALSFILVILVFVHVQSSPSPSISTLSFVRNALSHNMTNASRPDICLMYDRPPQTASTTTGRALQSCWASLGFTVVNWDNIPANATVSRMVESEEQFVASVGSSVHLGNGQYDLLYSACRKVFYVTSTRSMKQRIVSSALSIVKNRYPLEEENPKLNAADIQAARLIVKRRRQAMETTMEDYPFIPESRAVQPDYVIRYEHFADDLRQLLMAFHCDPMFEQVNVNQRTVDKLVAKNRNVRPPPLDPRAAARVEAINAAKVLQDLDVTLKLRDSRHRKMSAFAKDNNDIGLDKAGELSEQVLRTTV